MREWLVTNGLGSYASLTNSFENSRKYHGLLVASLQPPTRRWVFVSNIYEKIDKGRFEATDFIEKSRIPDYVSEIIQENDIVLVLGAGDIREISGAIVEKIKERIRDNV